MAEGHLIRGRDLKDVELWRLCNPDLVHRGFVWQEGENIDTLPFNASGHCEPGGLYFCCLEDVLLYSLSDSLINKSWIGRIALDDDEPVWYDGKGKWKAHKVHLHSLMTVEQFVRDPTNLQNSWRLLARHQWHIANVMHDIQSKELLRLLLERYPHLLEHVPRENAELFDWVFNKNRNNLRLINDADYIMKKLREDGMLLQFVMRKNRTPDMVHAAIEQNPDAVKFVSRKQRNKLGIQRKP